MRAIDAMQIINREGLDNTRWDVMDKWRERCEFFGYDNVKMAEQVFGSGRFSAIATYVTRYTPVDSVLFVWLDSEDEESEFSKIDTPIVIVKTCDGNFVEFYELD
jgi:hypothetical protein